jgi:C1A family cysteine protease
MVGDAPDSVDWVAKGMVSAVKNQEQCGSCWAFSTTGAMEARYKIATGKTVSLSEQQFVDCAGAEGNAGCSGGLPTNAFQYAEKTTICTESEYSYIAKDETCKGTTKCDGVEAGKLTGYKTVANSEEALMDAVSSGPVSVGIEADKAIFQHYKSGVLSGSCGGTLDHAVLVTGYGEVDGQKYWRVKNSWGATWGDDGYINLLKGKKGFGPFAGTGECGIRGHASYPVFGSSEVVV